MWFHHFFSSKLHFGSGGGGGTGVMFTMQVLYH
jgi:hypothetical protein